MPDLPARSPDPSDVTHGPRILRNVRFPDERTEARFRRAALPGDRAQAALMLLLVIPVGVVFGISDVRLLALVPETA
ncbi:MAG: hypothetical protein R3324_18360 [Halobacteriales archaeon]|nr:hypothetical protein [Halobacteriales archaeon]